MNGTTMQGRIIKQTKRKYNNFNLGAFLLYVLPIAYMAIIIAVLVHEILGHGLFTMILGGKFLGFTVLVDGMGWVNIDVTGVSQGAIAMMLLSGALLTNLLAIVLFALSYKLRKNNIMSITLLFFALSFLMDGVPYFLWDAIYQGGIGDVSNILKLYPKESLRISIIIINGILGILGLVFFNFSFMEKAVVWYGRIDNTTELDPSSREKMFRRNRMVMAAVIYVIQALAWLSFDWTQLIPVPNVGIVPSLVAIILTGITLIGFLVLNNRKIYYELSEEKTSWRKSIIFAWSLCIFVAAIIILFCQNGVMF